MRARMIFLVVAIVLLAGFAAQNWPEFTRTSLLNFGVVQQQASVGLILLGALALMMILFLVSSAMHESRYVFESRRHARSLQAQRDLAEKAEASRFTDLRQQLDAHLRENRQRESIAATELEKAMVQSQRELRNQLDLINRTLDGRLTELEGRLAARLERIDPAAPVPPIDVPPRDRIKA